MTWPHVQGATVTPAKRDDRICFGLAFFVTEAEADEYAVNVQAAGRKYNGGYFHGMDCGRSKGFDHTDEDGVQYYAVTD